MQIRIAALGFLAALIFSSPVDAKKLDRDSAMKRIEKACHEDLKEEDSFENYKEVCACSVRNLRKHIPDEHLDLITRSHEGDESAGEELQKPENVDLLLMDYDISYSCSNDPKFVFQKDEN